MATEPTLDQSLTLRPLQQVLQQSVPEIHHSDQEDQYLSTDYISPITDYGIDISLAHRGCPWENGYAERRPIRTLKGEEVHLNDYDDIADTPGLFSFKNFLVLRFTES